MKKRKNSPVDNNFIVQGSILTFASIIARVIGLIYRVPLTNILGDSGNSFYSTANEIYSLILLISAFSLPLALSRLMSERIERGEYRNANKLFLCAMRLAVVGGGAMALLTYAFAGIITKYVMNFEYAKYGLRVIAPAILVFAITGTFRGFFQGFGNMRPTAASQVIEQIVNAILSVVCAGLLFTYGESLVAAGGDKLLAPAWGAAGGNFGTVGSVTIAMLFMMVMYTLNRRTFNRQIASDDTGKTESSVVLYKLLLATIGPIILSTLIYNISTIVDQGIFNWVLKSQGYTEEQYSIIWGIYVGKFRVLMNVVLSLASSLGPAIVPSLTATISRRDRKEAQGKVGLAIRFTMIFSIPCAFGLAALGGPITEMLFHPETGVPLAAGMMQAGTIMIILYALSTVSTSILQGMGKERIPVIHCTIALVIHVIAVYVMLRYFMQNIYAVIYGNILFALIVSILNAITIARLLRYRQEVLRTFLIPTVASVIMAFGTYGVYRLMHNIFGITVSTVIAILFGVAIYFTAMVALRGVTSDEVLMLPKGRVILRLINRMGFRI
ncbi:MAG: polysaccharide biosynthesis protein [Lachnospiraceae bacterium]|nr:polysaccharide biosynthesis protein [Lachnospiraceae bacterium]